MGWQAIAPLLGLGGKTASAGVVAGTTAAATASAPTLASTFAPALSTSAAHPLAHSFVASQAAVAGQGATAAASKGIFAGITGADVAKGALAVAPSAVSALAGRGGSMRVPRPQPVDSDLSSAVERDRLRRAQAGGRKTILTGPGGAPGSPLIGRTILSGG